MSIFSTVKIARMALANLSAATSIESLTEDTAEAKVCNLFIDLARLETLAAHNWTFARKRTTLSTDNDDAPTNEWAYRYQYPADCVKPRWIENPFGVAADPVPYDVETNDDGSRLTIVTDEEDAVLVYTFDQTDPNMFSPHFIDTFSYRLAAFIAQKITGSSKLKSVMLGIFDRLAIQAPAYDAMSAQGRAPRDADVIRARTA